MSSQTVNDNVNVTTMKEKKPRKSRAPKTDDATVTEPTVVVEPVVETTVEPVVVESSEPIEKKKREPGLPAKYSKFLQFGIYLAESLKDTEGNITINSYDDFINKLYIFDTVNNQQNFVQTFFDQSKDINKSIKKMIVNKKKADAKAAKLANKPLKKTNKNNKNISNDIATNENDPFVSEVVSLANPTTKPKRKYNKKTIDTKTDTHTHNDSHNDDELDVEIIQFDNINYLVDSNKRIFHFDNHNLIGHIDNNNLLVLH